MRTRRVPTLRILTLGTLLLAACGGDSTTPRNAGPGTLGARIAGPNGSEGAAHVRLVGSGIGSVTASSGRVFVGRSGDTVDVVLARATPGTLDLSISLTDTTRLPVATVLEVSGPDDALRSGVGGYTLEWVR